MAILLLDAHADGCRVGLLTRGKVAWKRSASPRRLIALLSDSGRSLAARKPSAVCVLSRTDATFSNVRSATAVANALAFAWRLPVCAADSTGRESAAELSALAEASVKKTKLGVWIKPNYQAEPNITYPKK